MDINNSCRQTVQQYRQIACLLSAGATRACRSTSTALVAGKRNRNFLDCDNDDFPSQLVSQHMLWNHPGYVPVSLLLTGTSKDRKTTALSNHTNSSNLSKTNQTANVIIARTKKKATSTTTTMSDQQSVVYLPCCLDCGTALQPGYQGTTVRLKSVESSSFTVRVSRTQRRRMARRRSKRERMSLVTSQANRNKKKKLTVSSNFNNSGSSNDALLQGSNLMEFLKQQCQQRPPRDGYSQNQFADCRNYITMTCGSCGSTTQIPGIRKKKNDVPPPDKSQKLTATISRMPTKGTKASGAHNFKKHHGESTKKRTSAVDFIALDDKASASNKTRSSDKSPLGKRATISSVSSRKKKKKRPTTLDFLSSLNDH